MSRPSAINMDPSIVENAPMTSHHGIIPPTKAKKKFKSKVSGTIVKLINDEFSGFIQAKLPKKFAAKDVLFSFRDVKNFSDEPLSLACGMKVHVKPNHQYTLLANPRAFQVMLCHLKCQAVVAKQGACGHLMHQICSDPYPKCTSVCKKMMSCNLHPCTLGCGEIHSHDICKEIKYNFLACGHEVHQECWQSANEAFCQAPCNRKRSCGHDCQNKCGESCEKGDCGICDSIRRTKLEFRRLGEEKAKELEALVAKHKLEYKFEELAKSGSTYAEYLKVEDKVINYILPEHGWSPTVTKVSKIVNWSLEAKFERAKAKMNGDNVDLKFHGSTTAGINGIIEDGFKLPQHAGMFGAGIYFATNSSKSSRYCRGSNKLLLCEVLLGNSKVVMAADSAMNAAKLGPGYDSVFAPRGSGVMNDEFIVFDPDQALPKYLIEFNVLC